jgi:uncharacterized protein with GYD domain
MGKYLFAGSYTTEGLNRIMSAGAVNRRAAIDQMAASVGGSVESVYWGFGDTDVYLIADLPSDEAAAALSLRVSASGVASTRTVKLLTAEQIDAAIAMEVDYQPPGS